MKLTGCKGSQEVVGADGACYTNDKESQRQVLGNIRFTIDEPFAMRELHHMGECDAQESAKDRAKYYLVYEEVQKMVSQAEQATYITIRLETTC
jgi:hypothetical protein